MRRGKCYWVHVSGIIGGLPGGWYRVVETPVLRGAGLLASVLNSVRKRLKHEVQANPFQDGQGLVRLALQLKVLDFSSMDA